MEISFVSECECIASKRGQHMVDGLARDRTVAVFPGRVAVFVYYLRTDTFEKIAILHRAPGETVFKF